ncbi:hypothetical protein [Wukongibacter sp. M2B1]
MREVKKIELLMTKQDAQEYLEFLKAKKSEDFVTIAELEIFIRDFDRD